MKLADWLKGDHDATERLQLVDGLCRAVAEGAGRGSLALDPARIQVDTDGAVRLEEGSPPGGRYRPPETAEGQPATPQAQVYTVGVLSFEILAGRPFEARGGPLLRDVRPDLPRDLSDAVQACLEQDAEWRPKDISYLRGLLETLVGSAPAPAKTAARGSRAASPPTPASRPSRRSAPAPRSGPLLVFALVVLAIGLVMAVLRLREFLQPPAAPAPAPARSPAAARRPPASEAPSSMPRPPAAATPAAAAAARRAVPSAAMASPARAASGPASPAAVPLVRPAASPTPGAAARGPSRASSPTAAPATTLVAAASVAPATPEPRPSAPASPPSTEAAGPAGLTNVSPPLLHRGATVLVDVHGIGLRSDHQVRIARGREAARGIDVVRQRYVGPTLLQVLLRVDPTAAPGAYVVFLVDDAGHTTNPRPLEIGR